MRRQRGRMGLMAAALVGLLANGAAAEVTTEQRASILVFPKVIADGTRDTIIQITNAGPSMVHAHCFYVNGALTDPTGDPGPANPPLWTETDFDIWLTKFQPTQWAVSAGRVVDTSGDADVPCNPNNTDCQTAGFDPGRVPPVVGDFTGELKCIEVDASGAPLSGNHLMGLATLETINVCNPNTGLCQVTGTACTTTSNCESGGNPFGVDDIAKYNAIGIRGNETNNGDSTLCLGGGPGSCPNNTSSDASPEYEACPQTWILNHLSDGAEDQFISGGSVTTDITVVPCAENFETQAPTSVTIQFAITNEFEQTFSASTTVTCWAEETLSDINEVFSRGFVGTDFVQTRMRPSSGTASGFLVVADERHVSDNGFAATAASNLHVEGQRPGPDLITIPAEQIQ